MFVLVRLTATYIEPEPDIQHCDAVSTMIIYSNYTVVTTTTSNVLTVGGATGGSRIGY